MNKIHVLDEYTASQIAAGEVIERPAGVLKELLENAVDAGATRINIDILKSGRELIRVNDDGHGMSKEDLELSILRHATSKINNFSDLDKLTTFGFRGEALYSIAAISRMSITSCQEGQTGNTIALEGGKLIDKRPSPSLKGTTVEIRDLFFNTPARLKFLKTEASERAALLKVIEEHALANVQVSYNVTINGREVYRLNTLEDSFENQVRSRAGMILGEEVAQNFIFHEIETMRLKIFLTPMDKLVALRDMQYTFINKRPIDSKIVVQAVYKAYQTVRAKDKYPAFIIFMNLDASEFDVNIHPQKRDVRFVDEHKVFSLLKKEIEEVIFSNDVPVQIEQAKVLPTTNSAEKSEEQIVSQPEIKIPTSHIFATTNDYSVRETNFLQESAPSVVYQEELQKVDAQESLDAAKEPVFEVFREENLPQWFHGPYNYIGQIHKSYLLFENPEGLVIIDQHAAQERVLFEQYLDAFEKHDIKVQPNLFPVHVDLPPSNVENLLSWKDWLKTAGFEIAPFSASTVQIVATPYIIRFKEETMKDFIVSLAQIVGNPTKSTETLKRNMVAMLACKRAIKAHDKINAVEAEALLENMKKCKDGMHCPHGRPSVAVLNLKDIDKLFGR